VIADGFRLALLVAGAYAALAVLAALTLTASRRTQDLAFLRTLGLSGLQATGVTIIEHGTPVIIALVPGVLTGIAIARLLEGSLGLGAFIGPEVPFRIHVEWPGIVLVAVSLMMVVAVAIATSTWLARRARTVDALRVGEA
jgi:predicted lysophospholipase L1 biosynthesis ABC-type transport system permease subunit